MFGVPVFYRLQSVPSSSGTLGAVFISHVSSLAPHIARTNINKHLTSLWQFNSFIPFQTFHNCPPSLGSLRENSLLVATACTMIRFSNLLSVILPKCDVTL